MGWPWLLKKSDHISSADKYQLFHISQSRSSSEPKTELFQSYFVLFFWNLWLKVLGNKKHLESELNSNRFKSATLLSATHECTPKIWAKHERHSFQNWRVQIERHSFLGVSEVKECTLWKSLKIYRILTRPLIFFCAARKMKHN